MIKLYGVDLQYKPWPFCSINQFCTHISKPGYPLQFWSPDLTLCLTKASIKIMTSLKIIIIITIHVIIVINCASMKLQVKFKQHIITFQTFWLKTGGGGGRERHLFQRECLLEGGHLIKSLQHVNNFVVIIWWKLLKYFTYSWRKTAKIKQTLLDSCGEPKLITFKIENLSTCLKKKTYKDIFGL